MKKVLNLFAGIGGNRKFWKDVKVTAIEYNKIIAETYRDNFPEDEILITDALQFLESCNLEEYDFIWFSPPCPTHTMLQMTRGINIPDMTSLYGVITFLKYKINGENIKWCGENVRPWYKPLIEPTFKLGRHYFWANFNIIEKEFHDEKMNHLSFKQLADRTKTDFKKLCYA